MGAQSCKCDCDAERTNEHAQSAFQQSSFAEEVESKTPRLPAAAAVAAPSETKRTTPLAEAETLGEETYTSQTLAAPPPPPAPAPAPELAPPSPAQAPAPQPLAAEQVPKGEEPKLGALPLVRKLVFYLVVNKPLGVRFEELTELKENKGVLVVTLIQEDSAFIRTKDGYLGICVGDVVTQVNGETGTVAKLLSLLQDAKRQGGILEIVVQPRPATFEVTLQKTGDENMGIVVAVHDDTNDKLEIRRVTDEGAVPLFNQKNPNTQVVAGDWITAINNAPKGANELIEDLQACWNKRVPFVIHVMSYPTETTRSNKLLPVAQ